MNKPDRLEGSGVPAVNQDTGAGLAETPVTRARAIKLLGAMGATGALILAMGNRRLSFNLMRQAMDSTAKLSAFGAVEYDRVIHLDSDITLLQHMDELFFLPATTIAMPRAYSSRRREARCSLPGSRRATRRARLRTPR